MNRSMRRETLEAEIGNLSDLGLSELRALAVNRLGRCPTLASTELTRRWLVWELQAATRGGLDAGTRRRLRQLVRSTKASSASDTLPDTAVKPGTVLTREWADTVYRVVATESGFSWNGRTWSSLSEIAFRITGTRWSGPRFFGLKRRKDR
jgi:hypothetical protein